MSAVLGELDILRSRVLKRVLSVRTARSLFTSRAERLLFFFLVAAGFDFILSLAVPIWMLALGPVIFGVPHLFAGARYIPRVISGDSRAGKTRRVTRWSLAILIAVAGVRIFQFQSGFEFFHAPPIPLPNVWEWSACFMCLILFGSMFRLSGKRIWNLLLLAPLIWGSWSHPLWTAGFLALGHNFVAFFFWVQAAHNAKERRVAVFALCAFASLTCAILLGACDHLMSLFLLPTPFFGAHLEPLSIGQMILPGSVDFVLLDRVISAYAFGQAMHYFVWLKAVPEQTVSQGVPLSFSQSGRDLKYDLGKTLAILAAVLSLSSVLAMALFKLEVIRDIYVAGSSAHGYLEFAGLPFLFGKKSA